MAFISKRAFFLFSGLNTIVKNGYFPVKTQQLLPLSPLPASNQDAGCPDAAIAGQD